MLKATTQKGKQRQLKYSTEVKVRGTHCVSAKQHLAVMTAPKSR